jgi:hypothetical protein
LGGRQAFSWATSWATNGHGRQRAQIGKVVIRKVDRLICVRFGSARYSVPSEAIGTNVELTIRDGVITVGLSG